MYAMLNKRLKSKLHKITSNHTDHVALFKHEGLSCLSHCAIGREWNVLNFFFKSWTKFILIYTIYLKKKEEKRKGGGGGGKEKKDYLPSLQISYSHDG